MKKILAIIMIALSLSATAQGSYTFSFDIGKFTIKQVDSVTVILPEDQDYTCTLDPDGPALPMAIHKILNPYSTIVTTFNMDVNKRLIASDVLFEANGLPIATDQEIPVGSEPVMATSSEMDAVSLLDGNAEQNGYSYSVWAVKPFLYDAVTKELYFVESVTLTPIQSAISRAGGIDVVLRPDLFDSDGMLNTAAFSTYPTMESRATADSEKFDYLIVTADSLIPYFYKFIRWKLQKGVRTKIVSIESILSLESIYSDDTNRLKEYIHNRYVNNGITYVLLGGNKDIIPVKYCNMQLKTQDALLNENLPADLFYSCFDKNFIWNENGNDIFGERDDNVDLFPEIMLSRIPANNGTDIENFTSKIIKYEQKSPQNDFAKQILLSGMKLYYEYNNLSDSYYVGQIIANNYITPYWQGDIHFLFDTNPDNSDNFSTSNLTKYIDSEYNIIDVITHGGHSVWATEDFGYNTNNVISQKNENASIYVTSACHTNGFDRYEFPSLSEALINQKTNGAVAYIGASRQGLTSTSHEYIGEFSHLFESIFMNNLVNTSNPNYDFHIGRSYNVAKNLMSYRSMIGQLYCDSYLFLAYGINFLGDPEMSILTENPQPITAKIRPYYTESTIYIDIPESVSNNVTITITDDRITPVLYSTYHNISEVNFAMPEVPYVLTISSPNHYPYIYRPTRFNTLHLHDCVIENSISYTAAKIILGKNVTIKNGATLKLTADEEFEIRDNVVCEKGAKLELKHKTEQ